MSPFHRIPEAEVLRLFRKARQAQLIREAHNDVAVRAAAEIESERGEAAFRAVVDSEQRFSPPLPVPAYIAPVKRWAGGDAEMDLWYWDFPSY